MFGGEKVTMAFMGLLPFIVPIPFMGLHIFVGVVQAYVFMLLTMVYVGEVLPHEAH
jgi:F-type H+-transporting ATPase subunit a